MELSYVQFELRACRNQYDGCVYYGVINTVSDEQSKLGTKYTVPQIAFYKAIVSCYAHICKPSNQLCIVEITYILQLFILITSTACGFEVMI